MKSLTVVVILVGTILTACTNITQSMNGAANSLTNPAFAPTSAAFTHIVNNVNLKLGTSGTSPDWTLSLAVNQTLAGFQALTQFCGTGTSKPCVCELDWTQLNTIGGNSVSVPRTKKLVVTAVQGTLVQCQMTQAFWNEIPDGTVLQMNIVAGSMNASGLKAQAIGYKKGTSTAPTGDFVDNTLTPFRNIYRYTCLSKQLSSFEVLNSYGSGSKTVGGVTTNVNILSASSFCTSAGQTNCQNPRTGYSAQSYYRNLFIRSDNLGQINSTNANYDCPKALESISYSASVGIPPAAQGKYWPLDTTFAVATTKNNEWSVQIPAASILMKTGDANSIDDGGINTSDRLQEFNTSNGGIAWKILGYAKPPKADGTCGSIVDSNGRNRPLTRLRRYRVVYPGGFQNDGHPLAQRPEADQVYISDRLVVNAGGTLTGNMIYGPKPCNFAWFDHEGVTNRAGSPGHNYGTNFSGGGAGTSSLPTYQATANYTTTNIAGAAMSVNPDGRVLPNIDRDGTVGGLIPPSCSAAISVYDRLMGVPIKARLLTSYIGRTNVADKVTLSTKDFYLNEIHETPVDPWTPDYLEDTSFQACVAVADPYLEPPLHFFRDAGGTVAWCAKVYPTQNPYWVDLNSVKKPAAATISAQAVDYPVQAHVKWFTSHIKSPAVTGLDHHPSNAACTSTTADQICLMSLGSVANPDYNRCLTYLGTALTAASAVNNRCDRTVMFDSNVNYRGFPLLASDADITKMLTDDLAKDKNYACNYSVNSNPSKVNTSQPISNCCGVLAGTSILDSATKLIPLTPADQGHLEPFVNGAVPNIRFCGNPVE